MNRLNKNFGDKTSASMGAVSGAFATLIWGVLVQYGGIEPPPAEVYGATIIVSTWLWQMGVR